MSQTKAQLLAPIGIITCPGLDVTVGGSSPFQLGSTGIITAVSASFSGNVTVGGTLTYEEVTNIDSVGVITARDGIKVTGGGIDITGNIGLGGSTYGSSGQVLTSGGAGANATWSAISASPEMTGIASGSLGSGKPVALTQDGKLMPITGVTELAGTATAIPNTASSGGGALVYDSTNDKYVFFYRHKDNNQGQAIVGTLSGTTMTWGSAVTFSSVIIQTNTTHAAFDAVNGKVLCLYGEGSSNGKVVVGQVSGTGASATITFGTPVQVVSAHLEGPSLCVIGSNYAIAYNNGGNNKGRCRIGKYDGTNSSTWPNAEVEFHSAAVSNTFCWADTTENKLIIGFRFADGATNSGACMVGTIANDAVTINAVRYLYDSSNKIYQGCGVHDSSSGKNMIVYTGNSDHGYARVATVSGTSISYGTAKVISSYSSTKAMAVGYNSSTQKFLTFYSIANSPAGEYTQEVIISGTDVVLEGSVTNAGGTGAAEYTPSFIVYDSTNKSFAISFRAGSDMKYYIERKRSTNVTSSNYVGITKAAYTNGQTATLSVFGSVNEAVTGLTTATRYYVGADGSFITTADAEAISAGVALASNRLLLKQV